MRNMCVMPPILVTLGWMKSTAPAAIIFLKSEGLVAFSPIAIGTPVALRSFAADSKSSGGQIGSSTQTGFDGFIAMTGTGSPRRAARRSCANLDRDALGPGTPIAPPR